MKKPLICKVDYKWITVGILVKLEIRLESLLGMDRKWLMMFWLVLEVMRLV